MVANFKTEQSQRRLLTAVIAAHPELKLNFKGKSISIFIFICTPFRRYFEHSREIVQSLSLQ